MEYRLRDNRTQWHASSRLITKLHEWMDTFQMNPKAICAGHGFPTSPRHAGILPNAQRKENSDRTTYTMAELSRVGCTTVRDISIGTGGYSLQKLGPDHSGTNHSCPVDAQGSNGEKYTGDLKWSSSHGLGHGTKTKRSPGPIFHESRTAYIHGNQAGLTQ